MSGAKTQNGKSTAAAAKPPASIPPAGPPWTVITGDCVEVMKKHLVPRGVLADLIFADCPFNIGQEYADYSDRMHPMDFAKFMSGWLAWSIECLAENGTLCVHVPDKLVTDVEGAMRTRGMTRVEWIIWHYRFGECTRSGLISSKAHCLVYVRDPKRRTWNPDAILVESDRVKYGDKRTKESSTPGRRVPLDVWGVNETFAPDYPGDGNFWGRVQGNNAERRAGCPNQLPEVYLERIVRAFSNRGDLVMDPFTGSGTAGVISRALGRRFIGIELSPSTAEVARERIAGGAVRVKG